MWYEQYLIKRAVDANRLTEVLLGRHGLSETLASPPLVLGERVVGSELEPHGAEGALLAFLDPSIFATRALAARKKLREA